MIFKKYQCSETMQHHVQHEDIFQCPNLSSEWSQNRTWLNPPTTHSLSQVYFQPWDPCYPSPLLPQLCLIIKPEPLNSWGGVSFDECHQRSGPLLSCRHTQDFSVWCLAMCSDPSRLSGRMLHPKWSGSILSVTHASAVKSTTVSLAQIVAESFSWMLLWKSAHFSLILVSELTMMLLPPEGTKKSVARFHPCSKGCHTC